MKRLPLVFLAGVIALTPWQGFSENIASSIEKAVESANRNAEVVFDADGTLWQGDVGEAFFLWEMENNKFLPDQAGSARRLWSAYQEKRLSEREMWIGAATLQAGLRESDVHKWARQFFKERFRSKVFPAMQSAITEFQKRGLRVWIVSASHRWIIEAGAEYLKVPKTRVIAISARVRNGKITDEVENPVPFQAGKAEAISLRIGRMPAIAFGDSINDVPMLATARYLAVAVNPGESFRSVASTRGWSIQLFPSN